MRILPPALGAGLFGAVALAGCGKAAPASPPPPPPAQVAVVTVTPQTTEQPLEFQGQVLPLRTVQVRAQVTGVILARPFTEGTLVHARDVLYRIDPTTYDANYRAAVATAAQNQAQLANAQTSAGRLQPLLAEHAVAAQDVDNATAAVKQYQASLGAARAAADAARKSLSQTTVYAEVGGRVGRALLDVGTRVTGPNDVLTTIDVLDSVYVAFRPAAAQLLEWDVNPELGRAVRPGGSARVQAVFGDGSVYPTTSHISYVAPTVDSLTGTREYRATFAHAGQRLLPGQFVRVRLLGLVRRDALLVPQRAVQEQMGRQTLFVVDSADKVATRTVTAAAWSGQNWIITRGLAAGERVVVDGTQKIGPGATVRPTPYVPTSAADSSPASRPSAAATAGAR